MDRASELNERKVFCEIDAEAIQTLTEHKELISSALPKAIDRYFSKVAADRGALGYYRDGATQFRLKSDLLRHWAIVLDGSYDDAYVTSVFAIGELHAGLGPPHWFVSCYLSLVSDVVADVMTSFPARLLGDGAGKARLAGAIVKAGLFDVVCAVTAFRDAGNRARAALIGQMVDRSKVRPAPPSALSRKPR